MGEKWSVYRLSVRNPKGRRPQERPIHRWVDNIDGMVWTGLVWLRIGTSGELL
jgi:hypothetical protein